MRNSALAFATSLATSASKSFFIPFTLSVSFVLRSSSSAIVAKSSTAMRFLKPASSPISCTASTTSSFKPLIVRSRSLLACACKRSCSSACLRSSSVIFSLACLSAHSFSFFLMASVTLLSAIFSYSFWSSALISSSVFTLGVLSAPAPVVLALAVVLVWVPLPCSCVCVAVFVFTSAIVVILLKMSYIMLIPRKLSAKYPYCFYIS